jgi:ATP-dependent DNA helicase RecG
VPPAKPTTDGPVFGPGLTPPLAFAEPRELTAQEIWESPARTPRPSRLAEPLNIKPPTAQAAAESMGLETVGDLLEHLPRATGEARTIGELAVDETATVLVEVKSITSRPVRKRGMKPLVVATVSDGTGIMKATFFNQPWLSAQYPAGTRLMLAGKYQGKARFRVNAHAKTDAVAADATGGGGTAGQYPATKGISSTQLLALVQHHRTAISDFTDPLPVALRHGLKLPDRPTALAAAHFGDVQERGRRRLAFDELLVDQLVQLRLRRERLGDQHATALAEPPTLSAEWREEQLPFTPTGDQVDAMADVDADLAGTRPMQRLLMGEVGSGKTVVALHAMLRAVEHGGQAALMAPTETLAEQHFATIQALMPGSLLTTALLTGSTTAKRRREMLAHLATGELKLIVGTHALIEDPVIFQNLTVAVVDEQHRFGVRQRAALDAKARRDGRNRVPHLLHMTATPIPRTLRLANFGALDVTALRELPRGRQPITTHVCSTEAERHRAYERIREELRAGRQAFVVCPLVSESEALNARAATAEYERLQAGELADFEVVLLHGQMRSGEKQAAMERFVSGAAQVLVATTVIEVGIDVPNATVMLVEDADRYGISQLHQLRGRVGRGEHASLCLLFGPRHSARLKALERNSDGFRLAEIDLQLRGEGELTGTKQSGLARFRFARLPDDAAVLESAFAAAQDLLKRDPELEAPEHELLRVELARAEAVGVAA